MVNKRAIKVDTLNRLAEGFQESRGITDKLTIEQMIELAKVPTASGENKLAQFIDRTITEVTAEDLEGITTIGTSAFSNCTRLINATIPNNITSIDHNTFYRCTELTNVTIIGDSITNIGNSVFYDCEKLASVYYDGDMTFWCRGFNDYNSNPIKFAKKLYVKNASGEYELFTNFIISNSVISIGDNAFYNCESIINLTIPDGIMSIGKAAFSGCSGITNLTIPNSVTSIGKEAFAFCRGQLTSVIIPNSVTSIGSQAFYYCSNLASVRIGNGITSIGNSAFGSTALTDIYIDKPEGSISGSPWGATKATIHWNTPLPSEEV